MTRVYCLLAASCLYFASGCDQNQKPVPVVVAAPPSLDNLPLVGHPEYDNWSRFPVGTKVIRRDKLASSDGEVILHTTLRLASISEATVTIETQTAIERDGKRQDSDLYAVDYSAQFRLPKGMTIEQFQLPALKAKKLADETVLIAGRSFKTDVYTYEDQSEAGPVDVKLWRSLELPGRQAKKEIVDRQGLVLSSSSVVEISQP